MFGKRLATEILAVLVDLSDSKSLERAERLGWIGGGEERGKDKNDHQIFTLRHLRYLKPVDNYILRFLEQQPTDSVI